MKLANSPKTYNHTYFGSTVAPFSLIFSFRTFGVKHVSRFYTVVLSLKIYASYARTSPSISLHGRGDQIRVRVLLDEFLAPLPSKYSNATALCSCYYRSDCSRRRKGRGCKGGRRVGDGKGILQAAIAVPELIASRLLRLDTLKTNFLAAAEKRQLDMNSTPCNG